MASPDRKMSDNTKGDLHAFADSVIDTLKQASGRECGECSLCCYLLDIDDDNLKKPGEKWCPHFRAGCGCTIYPERPLKCRGFACGWLTGGLGDHWYPKKSRIVAHRFLDKAGMLAVSFVVHPRVPNRWREEPYYSDIKGVARTGLLSKSKFTTRVYVSKRQFLILPDREVEFGEDDVIMVSQLGDEFHALKFKTIEQAKQFQAFLAEFEEKLKEPAFRAEAMCALRVSD
jgi:hypothetical protein